MRWSTYTPDGRMLEIDHTDGTWFAVCNGVRGEGPSAAEALRAALDEQTVRIGSSSAVLAAWIEEQSSTLEREAGPGA